MTQFDTKNKDVSGPGPPVRRPAFANGIGCSPCTDFPGVFMKQGLASCTGSLQEGSPAGRLDRPTLYPAGMRFLILGNGAKPHVPESADRLAAAVRAAGGEVVLTDLVKHCDLSGVT